MSPPPPLSWRRDLPALAIPLFVALLVRGLALPHIEALWDADASTSCLLSLHHAQGKFPVFWYGQSYNGSLEALIAAPFMWLLGPHVAAMGLGMMLVVAVQIALIYRLARELVGPWPAAIGALPYAAGSITLMHNISGLNHSYTMISVIGVALLLVGWRFIVQPTAGRAFWIGLLIGLTHWNNPQGAAFIAPLGGLLLLRGRALAALLGRAEGDRVSWIGWARAALLCLLLLFVVTSLMTVTGGSSLGISGYEISMSKPQEYVVRSVLLIIGALVAIDGLLALRVPGEWRSWLALGAAFGVGALIGVAPEIMYALQLDHEVISSGAGLAPAHIAHHARLLWSHQAGELLFGPAQLHGPGHGGMPDLLRSAPWLTQEVWEVARWPGLALFVLATATALWCGRRPLGDLLRLRPPSPDARGTLLAMVAIQALASLALYLMFPRLDLFPKYLQPIWIPLCVAYAMAFEHWWRHLRVLAYVAGVAAALHWGAMAVINVEFPRGKILDPGNEIHEIRALAEELKAKGVTRGWCNYWYAYRVTFLTGEEVILREWPAHVQRQFHRPYAEEVLRAMADGERFAVVLGPRNNVYDEERAAWAWFDQLRARGTVVLEDADPSKPYRLFICRQPKR